MLQSVISTPCFHNHILIPTQLKVLLNFLVSKPLICLLLCTYQHFSNPDHQSVPIYTPAPLQSLLYRTVFTHFQREKALSSDFSGLILSCFLDPFIPAAVQWQSLNGYSVSGNSLSRHLGMRRMDWMIQRASVINQFLISVEMVIFTKFSFCCSVFKLTWDEGDGGWGWSGRAVWKSDLILSRCGRECFTTQCISFTNRQLSGWLRTGTFLCFHWNQWVQGALPSQLRAIFGMWPERKVGLISSKEEEEERV